MKKVRVLLVRLKERKALEQGAIKDLKEWSKPRLRKLFWSKHFGSKCFGPKHFFTLITFLLALGVGSVFVRLYHKDVSTDRSTVEDIRERIENCSIMDYTIMPRYPNGTIGYTGDPIGWLNGSFLGYDDRTDKINVLISPAICMSFDNLENSSLRFDAVMHDDLSPRGLDAHKRGRGTGPPPSASTIK